MKKNKDFIVREIAGETILVPSEETAHDFNGMISLTDTAAFIWEHIEEVKDFNELVDMMLNEYDIDRETAMVDISCFIVKLLEYGMIRPSGLNW